MNFLLLSLAVFLMSIAAVNCKANKSRMSHFKQWCVDNGGIGLIVWGGACGLLVLVITWPLEY